jgi:CDP-diacylglycerol--glycerol-3-phosphate 3-phosphatidyltransferase
MEKPQLAPADYLTLPRLLSVPVLWALASIGATFWLGVGLALAGLTDVLDGPVARYTGKSSRWGGQLDSAADILLMASIFWWFVLLTPEFFLDNATPLVVWAVIGTVAVVATYIRYGRFGNLHLYSAKAAGVLGYLFAVSFFVFDGYSPLFFHVAVTAAIIGSAETLLVALLRRRASDRIGSILLPGR